MSDVSFANDIKPILQQYMGQMMWRFDMTNYEAVKGNAAQIQSFISLQNGPPQMPPMPWSGLSQQEVDTFNKWVGDGCQP